MSEGGKSNLGATATIVVAIIGLLTAVVGIVPKLLDSIPKEKTIQTTVNEGSNEQQQNNNITPSNQGGQGGGSFVPDNSTDAEKEALKKKQAQLEQQMEQMKKDLEAQKKRGNASSGGSSDNGGSTGYGGEDDVYYKPVKVSGRWNVAGYPGMQYIFSQNGSNITFTMMNNGMNTGSGQGFISGNYIQFEAMDMQSTYTGSLELNPNGTMTGVAYNAYGQYFPMTLSK